MEALDRRKEALTLAVQVEESLPDLMDERIISRAHLFLMFLEDSYPPISFDDFDIKS